MCLLYGGKKYVEIVRISIVYQCETRQDKLYNMENNQYNLYRYALRIKPLVCSMHKSYIWPAANGRFIYFMWNHQRYITLVTQYNG